MLSFKYTARNPDTGEKIKANVQAESEQAAAKLIHQQGLAPISIELEEGGNKGFSKFLNRINTKDKVLFTRQLSTLINAGLPIIQSLRSVAQQTSNKKFKVIINQIISDVEAGSSLSVAMARYPAVFNQIYISLVASGEASGTLDAALERIANQQEKDAEIASKIRGAMAYPIVVLLVMILVVGFMVVKVLPQVQGIYTTIPGASLPLVTRVLLAVSHFVTKFWWIVLIVLGLLVFFGSRWARTGAGKEVVDGVKMHAWPVGPLFMKVYMARFARTGTTLVASGVPLIQMIQITADAVNNVHIARSLNNAIEKVKGGKALSESLEGDPNFLELVPNMLHIGEQSGAIEQMLEKVATYYEKEVDNQIKTISTLVEPVMMVLLGAMALIIVAAILLPIYSLAGKNIVQ